MTLAMPSAPVSLAPLTSIRFLAALHIFIFHVDAGRQFSPNLDLPEHVRRLTNYPVFDQIPAALLQCVRHGYCSTSLFFTLSGFILAYLYIDRLGKMTIVWPKFLWARLSRVYPLHILLVVCLFPIAMNFRPPNPTFLQIPIRSDYWLPIGALLSMTLTQAWIPEFALSFNLPTWSLSAIVFFYVTFPWIVRAINALSDKARWIVLGLLPVVGLLPSLVYYLLVVDEQPLSFWSEFVMRTPLFWFPHFAMGMLLARVFKISRYDIEWRKAASSELVSWGDLAAVVLLAVFCAPDDILKKYLTFNLVSPNFIIRHGLLSPLYLFLIYDLAIGRGLLAKLLSFRPLALLGEASFSIFMLQFPVLIMAYGLAYVWPGDSGSFLILMTVILIAASVASVRWFEKPVSNWLRRTMSFEAT